MGAEVNISSRSWNHATSLHFCSQLGKMENLKLLLKYGANVFLKDKCGHTAKDRAQKHPECEKILQEQEGKIQSPDKFAVYFYNIHFWGGALSSRLVRSSPVWLQAFAGDIVLCSWVRHFILTVPLSTRVY